MFPRPARSRATARFRRRRARRASCSSTTTAIRSRPARRAGLWRSGLRGADRDSARGPEGGRARARVRPRQDGLRSSPLPSRAPPQAGRVAQRGSVQGLGLARIASGDPEALGGPSRRRPEDGRHPSGDPDGRDRRGGGGLRRCAVAGRAFVQRDPEHPGPAPRAAASRAGRRSGRAAPRLRAGGRLQPVRQLEEACA